MYVGAPGNTHHRESLTAVTTPLTMKASVGIVIAALVTASSFAAGEDTEERERHRVRAEKLAAISSQMSQHLRTRGGDGDHAQTSPASLKRQARKDEVSLKGQGRETSAGNADHAEKIRRVADQLSKVARPTAHNMQPARLAQHSFADVKKNEMSRKPSANTASAAKKVEHKQAMQKLAKKMAAGFDPASGRSEVVAGGRGAMKMKAAHDAQSNHSTAPKKLQDSGLKNVQHRLAQTTHKKMKAKEAANNGEGGEE